MWQRFLLNRGGGDFIRTLRKNQQSLKYALQLGEAAEFETDENGNVLYYEDGEGNRYPLATGNFEVMYGEVNEFMGNIAMSGGEAEAVEYGLSVEQYSAVIVAERGAIPISEGAIIWYTSTPEYKNNGDEISVDINEHTIHGKFAERTSADFQVVKKSTSLNVDKFILEAVNK